MMYRIAEPGRASATRESKAARLFRLGLAVLALALIAGVSAPLVSAATPGPDPAPVPPSPPPVVATQPSPTPTYTPPTTTTRSTTTKATTNSHKRKGHKRVIVKVKPKPIQTTVQPTTIPLGATTKGLHSKSSDTLRLAAISLVGVGTLLLALAALEPGYIRPRRLIMTFAKHRAEVATAGAVLLFSVAIAYLSSAL